MSTQRSVTVLFYSLKAILYIVVQVVIKDILTIWMHLLYMTNRHVQPNTRRQKQVVNPKQATQNKQAGGLQSIQIHADIRPETLYRNEAVSKLRLIM